MAHCPEREALLEIDALEEVEEGYIVSCPECVVDLAEDDAPEDEYEEEDEEESDIEEIDRYDDEEEDNE